VVLNNQDRALRQALLGQTKLLENLFPDPVREQPAIQVSAHQRLVDSLSSLK